MSKQPIGIAAEIVVENDAEDEQEDLAAVPPQSSARHRGHASDPVATLVKSYYAAQPFVTRRGTHHELEVRFGTRGIRHITKSDYDSVIQRLKSAGFHCNDPSGQYSLRIQNEMLDSRSGKLKLSDNLRFEIYGLPAIQAYCKSNDLKSVMKTYRNAVKFVNKHNAYLAAGDGAGGSSGRVPNAVMEAFNFVVSYKIEEDMNVGLRTHVVENWANYQRQFRYLNRVTFVHPSLPFAADISIVKSSPRVAGVPHQFSRYYNIGEAGVFTNLEEYEIELEVDTSRIGPGTPYNSAETLLAALKHTVKLVLCGLQHTNYPVSYPEQRDVLAGYLALIHGGAPDPMRRIYPNQFIGPSSYTLQMQNIVPPDANSNAPNIRSGYVVTDKADGARHLLYIAAETGKLFMIDTNMSAIFTGAKTNNKEVWNSLLDGELIAHNKSGGWLNWFAAFDVYYLHGSDVRAFRFMDAVGGGAGSAAAGDEPAAKKQAHAHAPQKETRYNLLRQIVDNLHLVSIVEHDNKMSPSPLHVTHKEFYAVDGEVDGDNADIFAASAHIIRKAAEGIFVYNVDGLIYTHASYGVGSNQVGVAGPKQLTTWDSSFKWKPPQYNTIDFLVTTVKNKTGEDLVRTAFEDGMNADQNHDLQQYKTVQLRVTFAAGGGGVNRGATPRVFYQKACQAVYDDAPEDVGDAAAVQPLQFYPTSPYDPDAGTAFIDLRTDAAGVQQMFTTEGAEIFADNTIVEFAYDFARPAGWRWVPLRVRHDKTAKMRGGDKYYGNAYHVANNIWQNIHNPISADMIATGAGIVDAVGAGIVDTDVYYNRGVAGPGAGGRATQAMRNFHNLFVKKALIEGAVGSGSAEKTLIDFACGKAGDLNKWIAAGVGFVFGIDLSIDNLENPLDGACARYLNARRTHRVVPAALFVNGNSGHIIRSGAAMLTEKGATITRAVFGQGEKSAAKLGAGVFKVFGKCAAGFDVGSMQFALHYMFENERMLQNFAVNLAECIALGGYFIATCYNGHRVFAMLRDKGVGETVSLFSGGSGGGGGGHKIWSITRQYAADINNLADNVSSLGLRIDVYQESINQTIAEYLVNPDFFIRVMEEYGFVLPSDAETIQDLDLPKAAGSFAVLYAAMVEKNRAAGQKRFRDEDAAGNAAADWTTMSEAEKTISFLNDYMIFKKVRHVDAARLNVAKMGDLSVLDMGERFAAVAAAMPPVASTVRRPIMRRIPGSTVVLEDSSDLSPASEDVAVAAAVPEIAAVAVSQLPSSAAPRKKTKIVPRTIVIDEDE